MQKTPIALLILISVLTAHFAYAQEDEAGILPDSPFYFVKLLFEKLRGILIFSEEAKVKYQLELAGLRLKEAEALALKGKIQRAEEIVARYKVILDKVNAKIDEVSRAKHIQVLEGVLERVPEQAKNIIRQVLERERAKLSFPLSPTSSPIADKCIVTGCSGQVCADREVITTCEWREEYACYRTAKCERQPDGQCGWTSTEELKTCLAKAQAPARSPAVSPKKSPSPSPIKLPTPSPTTIPTPSPPPPSPSPTTVIIRILSSGFSPSQVTIKKGTTVIFKNEDTRSHWPASDVHPVHTICPGFDSLGGLTQGESYQYAFQEAKTCPFHDHLIPVLTGTVIVE